jgi:hypothetical protein
MYSAESWDMETQPRVRYEPSDSHTMNGESRLLVTDELIEFGKLVEVQDIRTITDHFRIDKET